MPHAMKILVVEDNRKLAQFLNKALREEGYTVDLAGTTEAALAQLEALRYDLVILDWMLPGEDGVAVCRSLRARGDTTPILMLTARGEVENRIYGLDAGADDYLVKPFDLGELLARARALGRRTSTGAARLVIGPLVVDLEERCAVISGGRVDLTPRELSLLTALAREAGQVVPRSRLLARAWGIAFDPESNLVDVHVRHLREKLGAHAGLIETVRGVGYRLIVPLDTTPVQA